MSALVRAIRERLRLDASVGIGPNKLVAKVASELRKMTAFIRQEAMEKAREIHLKADEEFSIEKAQLVRQETSSIDVQYEKKNKQAGMSQQITRSTLANKTRLKLLSARQELLNDLFEQASKRLGEFTQDQGKYQDILKNLLLEGMYALNEKKVFVRCRKQDHDVVSKAAENAKKEYKDNLKGREVEVVVDEKNRLPDERYVYLPPLPSVILSIRSSYCSYDGFGLIANIPNSAGGISILNGTQKIDINNTFEERLHLLETDALPSVRTTLFGENQNRKFKD